MVLFLPCLSSVYDFQPSVAVHGIPLWLMTVDSVSASYSVLMCLGWYILLHSLLTARCSCSLLRFVQGQVRKWMCVSMLQSPRARQCGHHGFTTVPFSVSPLKALFFAVGRRCVISLWRNTRRKEGHWRPPVDHPGFFPTLWLAPSMYLA